MTFSHLDAEGRARMVDVGEKPVTARRAVAEATVRMTLATRQALASQALPKGDALVVAQTAGILAAKKTADLIPLCHALPLEAVQVRFTLPDPVPGETHATVVIEATASTTAKTGVELEALTAVTVAALTLYDMCKALDKGITIDRVRLLEKSGGRSGTYTAPDA